MPIHHTNTPKHLLAVWALSMSAECSYSKHQHHLLQPSSAQTVTVCGEARPIFVVWDTNDTFCPDERDRTWLSYPGGECSCPPRCIQFTKFTSKRAIVGLVVNTIECEHSSSSSSSQTGSLRSRCNQSDTWLSSAMECRYSTVVNRQFTTGMPPCSALLLSSLTRVDCKSKKYPKGRTSRSKYTKGCTCLQYLNHAHYNIDKLLNLVWRPTLQSQHS